MVISISADLLQKAVDGDTQLSDLLMFIFLWVSTGRHELIVEKGNSLQTVIESPKFSYFKELLVNVEEMSKERYKDDLIVRITQCSRFQPSSKISPKYTWNDLKIVVEKDGKRYEYIDISIVESYLGEKLRIFLENGKNDGYFLSGMYQLVKGEKLKEKLVEFMNGGGIDNLPNELERITQPSRVICLVDSDKKFPGHLNPQIRNLKAICDVKDFHCYVLKRMVENYIPENLLRKWLIDHNLADQHPYFSMNPDQKECFHLKNGLNKRDLRMNQVKTLYEDRIKDLISDEQLDLLGDEEKVIPHVGREIATAFEEICSVCSIDDIGDDQAEVEQIIALIDKYT